MYDTTTPTDRTNRPMAAALAARPRRTARS